jgi:hypothetical protein
LVICGSFGDIFKRNSINNGLILVESPDLIADVHPNRPVRWYDGQLAVLTALTPDATLPESLRQVSDQVGRFDENQAVIDRVPLENVTERAADYQSGVKAVRTAS